MLHFRLNLPVRMLPKPDETTCGPTCLKVNDAYFGTEKPLESVIARTHRLGGTLAVFLSPGGQPHYVNLTDSSVLDLMQRGRP